MERLVGHLRSVDPEASESLRIVEYFDVLIKRGAGVDGLLRGAAVLSGTVAGAEVRTRVSRRGPVRAGRCGWNGRARRSRRTK